MKKVFLITFLSVLFSIPAAATAATLSLEVPESVLPLQRFITTLSIDTEGEEINAISGILTVGQGVALEAVRTGGSVIAFWADEPKAEEGIVSFSGIIPGGYKGGDGELLVLDLRAIQEGVGVVAVSDFVALRNDGLGTHASTSDTMFSIPVAHDAQTLPASFRVVDDTVAPEVFEVYVEQNDDLFSGRYFAVFAASDKGSGIDYYEIQERDENRIDESAWVQASSPYELSDQSLNSFVFVKAIDNAGNTRTAVYAPEKHIQLLRYVIYGILLTALLYALVYLYGLYKRKKEI